MYLFIKLSLLLLLFIPLKAFEVSYAFDYDDNISSHELYKTSFTQSNNKMSFGVDKKVVWYKVEIDNNKDTSLEYFLHSDLAYMSAYVEIFEFDDNTLIKSKAYNIQSEEIGQDLLGASIVYAFKIDKMYKKTIYIRNVSFIHQVISLDIHNAHDSFNHLLENNFLSLIIISILFALALYNLMFFSYGKYLAFFYYALYLVDTAIGLMYMYGNVFSIFGIYGERVYWFNITAILVPLFVSLFVQELFEIKKANKTLHTLLNVMIVLSALNVAFAIIVDLELSMKYLEVLFLLSVLLLFVVLIYLVRSGHKLAKMFLLVYLLYSIGMSVTVASLIGFSPLNNWTFYASGMGLVLEALVFSYLLHHRLTLLEEELYTQQKTLILQKKKAQMGDMIGAITHQWKQPLNALSSVVTMLQYRIKKSENLTSQSLNPKLQQMEEQIRFLKKTTDDFRHFFHPQSSPRLANLDELIESVISLSSEELLARSIIITSELNFEKKIEIYESELFHIILNLIQNAQEAFEDIGNEGAVITIRGYTKDDKSIIEVIDNAQGVSKDVLPYIFDEFFTTKSESVGSGLGLYLSRLIIQEHMNGKIEAFSEPTGMNFRITI